MLCVLYIFWFFLESSSVFFLLERWEDIYFKVILKMSRILLMRLNFVLDDIKFFSFSYSYK